MIVEISPAIDNQSTKTSREDNLEEEEERRKTTKTT
jgi:hypothetical protein